MKFIRKPLYVDAVRITRANFEEVATWCQGEIQRDEVPGKGTSKPFIRVRVHNPKNPRQTKAMVGDWLLYTERGYKVYTNTAFRASFDEMPIQDNGDVVNIGPECFAMTDGSVLSWRGENYVPQESQTTEEVAKDSGEDEPGVALEEQLGEGLRGPERAQDEPKAA